MRIQIKNCVTDPRFKKLRQQGSPVFKPSILGSVLVPGAMRIVDSSEFGLPDVKNLDSLVKSGSCLVTEVGIGPVDFVSWISSFGEEPAAEVIAEPVEEVIAEEEPSLISQEELEEESEESSVQETSLHSEEDLLAMTNADLRDLALSLDPEAAIANKSKKKLVDLIMEIQNAS